MSKLKILLFFLTLLHGTSLAQSTYTLRGVVMDEDQQPLPGASVFLYPVEEGSITNQAGEFIFNDLKPGSYFIKVSYIGYEGLMDTIQLSGDKNYTAILHSASLTLQEVVVKDNYSERRKKEASLNIEIVDEEYLKQNLGGSLMNSLERLPGVTSYDIGTGQSKPVIRGLGFNRVVVVENNIKHEAQQWGADHGLEIDQYAAENVEVIKGPASLMYGSDAIGGVIEMENTHIPLDNVIGGKLDLTGKTNNDFLGTSLSVYGRKNSFFASARATLLDYGDFKVPTDSVDIYSYRAALHKKHLRNTAGQEQNLHFSFGIIEQQLQSRFYLSQVNSKSGFFANAHGLEPRNVDTALHDQSNRDIHYPYQKVSHFKAINSSFYRWDKLKLELNLGFQRNFRQEWSQYVQHGFMPASFPETLGFPPGLEREFEKYVYSGNLKFFYEVSAGTKLITGLDSEYQDNRIDGRGFIIPAYKQLTAGAFIIARHSFSDISTLQAGIRYDYGNIQTLAYHDWFPTPIVENADTLLRFLQRSGNINRSFSNLSWSVGYNHNPGKWSYKANIGKSFRIPIAKELAANGVNYHHFSYEVGNADLSPEISYQLDAGIEYGTKKFAIGITPFVNYFSNYIYLNPTAEHDRLYGNGHQVFNYTQSRVIRYGAELHAHYELLKFLQLGIMGEYVCSEQMSGEKKGFSLPFSPPPSGIFNIKLHKQQMKFIENAYFSFDYRITAAQNNIAPPEEPTDGYQLINLKLGGDFVLGNQRLSISMQVQNLMNAKYFNHTSYYRLINVPEPGRNIIINISIPFSEKLEI